MRRALLAAVFLILAVPGRAQVDPTPRRLIQLGYELPFSGPSPTQAYVFYYTNQPNFMKKDMNLRLALAPTYLDSELGFRHALGENVDAGIGLAGGGFADNYYEIRQGHYFKEESFNGDGFTVSGSLYPLLDPGRRIPLNGYLRVSLHDASYAATSNTAADFRLPRDYVEGRLRAGLRFGGQPPRLRPMQAGEVSVWYEGLLRDQSGPYGYSGDRLLARQPNYYWGRTLLNFMQGDKRYIEAVVQAGGSADADRISAYKLGGQLHFTGEFPLVLPGYYQSELTAKRYALASAAYGVPIVPKDLVWSRVFVTAANVTYLPGEGQSEPWNTGAGLGFRIESPGRAWLLEFDLAHGFEAIRSGSRGSNSVAIMTQLDLRAFEKEVGREPQRFTPGAASGLDWLGGLFR